MYTSSIMYQQQNQKHYEDMEEKIALLSLEMSSKKKLIIDLENELSS